MDPVGDSAVDHWLVLYLRKHLTRLPPTAACTPLTSFTAGGEEVMIGGVLNGYQCPESSSLIRRVEESV